MIKISKDQKEIRIDGVLYEFIIPPTYKPCDGCSLECIPCDCNNIPCAEIERTDKERKILKLKQ